MVAARRVDAVVHPAFFEAVEAQPRFDVVYHCDMLAHFHRPAEALRLMTRFLRPGGVLAFEVGFVADLPRFWYLVDRRNRLSGAPMAVLATLVTPAAARRGAAHRTHQDF